MASDTPRTDAMLTSVLEYENVSIAAHDFAMFARELERELAALPEEVLTTTALLQAMQDHYWDSLEPNRDIVIKHVESVLQSFMNSERG